MYLILNSVVKKLQSGSYKKWKYDETSQLFVSNIDPGDYRLHFNGVRKIIAQLYYAYIQRTCATNPSQFFSLSPFEEELLESVLGLSDESILRDFPGNK